MKLPPRDDDLSKDIRGILEEEDAKLRLADEGNFARRRRMAAAEAQRQFGRSVLLVATFVTVVVAALPDADDKWLLWTFVAALAGCSAWLIDRGHHTLRAIQDEKDGSPSELDGDVAHASPRSERSRMK